MRVDFETDLLVVKHESEHPDGETYHCFALWMVPNADPGNKELLNTFEGDYSTARDECRSMIGRLNVSIPVLWMEKEDEIYVHLKDT